MISPGLLARLVVFVLAIHTGSPDASALPMLDLETALSRAGDNRPQLEKALQNVPVDEREGLVFLMVNMPDQDARKLSSEFLLEHVRFAYRAWKDSPWKDRVPKEIFLNNILPYASVDEHRDSWRKDFHERFKPLVKGTNSPGQAAAVLNQRVFALLSVRYSRQRPKANQSPYESMRAGVASCTGLSVLLIDACRAVGVPARFAGTPLWSDRSGNHSWVEVWDDGWHFTGAAEPAGDELDKAWFVGRASSAQRDELRHAIYAVSFKRTPLVFPLVWNRRNRDVFAVNVTDRYTRRVEKLPEGSVRALFQVLDKPRGDRRAAKIRISDEAGQTVFEGVTNDERFDGNDHVTVVLQMGHNYTVTISNGEAKLSKSIVAKKSGQLFTFHLSDQS